LSGGFFVRGESHRGLKAPQGENATEPGRGTPEHSGLVFFATATDSGRPNVSRVEPSQVRSWSR